MGDNHHTTLADLIANSPDPDAGVAVTRDAAFATGPNEAGTAELHRGLGHPIHTLSYLAFDGDTQGPIVLTMPFSADTPGNPANTGYMYASCGDMGSRGRTPPLVVITEGDLEPTEDTAVIQIGLLAQAWTNRPAGQHGTDEVAANTEDITARPLVPLAKEHAPAILRAQGSGQLTWSWLWEHIMEPLVADPAQIPRHRGLLNWFRISSQLHQPDAQGDPVIPSTCLQFAGVYGLQTPLDIQEGLIAARLGGWRTSTPSEQSLHRMAVNQEQWPTQLPVTALPRLWRQNCPTWLNVP